MARVAASKKISIPGATSSEISDYAVPSIKRSPDYFIIHCGTNDLATQNPYIISQNIINISQQINNKLPNTKVYISSLIKIEDKPFLNPKIDFVNDLLIKESDSKGYKFINNSNIDVNDLNGSKLHLNKKGTSKLASNFIQNIKSDLSI